MSAKGEERSAKDGEGRELQVGDQVIVRGRVVDIPVDGLLQIAWESEAVLLDFVKAESVRKEQ